MSSKRTPADFHGDPGQSLLAQLINQAFYYTRRSFDEALRELDLTAAQAGVLRRICDNPGITGVEISRRMFTTPQAAQLVLATLEGKGLIERKPDPASRRIVRSFISEDGRRALEHAMPKMWEVEQALEGVLTAEECQQLSTLLQRYVGS
jgi:DNA-binding MarR family transcriptional regulator